MGSERKTWGNLDQGRYQQDASRSLAFVTGNLSATRGRRRRRRSRTKRRGDEFLPAIAKLSYPWGGNSRLMLHRGRARCGGLAGPPPFATDPWKRYLQYLLLLLLLQMIGVASSSGWWFSVKSTRGNDSPGCKFKAISFVLNSNEAVPLGLRQAVTLFLILNFGCLEPDVDWLNRNFWRWYPYFSCSNPHVFFVESHIVLLNPIFRTATSQNR